MSVIDLPTRTAVQAIAAACEGSTPGALLSRRTLQAWPRRDRMLEVDGDVPELSGHTCEAVLVQESWYRGERLEPAHALYLKLRDGPWHRVFFDGGILFWRPTRPPHATGEGIPADAFRYALVDVGAAHGLTGRRILGMEAHEQGHATELRLLFDSGVQLSLRHQDDVSQVLVRGR